MSQDVLQTKAGANAMGAPVNPSGFPAGFNYGREWGHVEGAAANCGGALYTTPTPRSGTVPTVASADTINHNGCGIAIVTHVAAVTGMIIQAGTVHGQHLDILNVSANTLTFNTTPATSRVAAAAATVAIPANAGMHFVWNNIDSLWYDIG